MRGQPVQRACEKGQPEKKFRLKDHNDLNLMMSQLAAYHVSRPIRKPPSLIVLASQDKLCQLLLHVWIVGDVIMM